MDMAEPLGSKRAVDLILKSELFSQLVNDENTNVRLAVLNKLSEKTCKFLEVVRIAGDHQAALFDTLRPLAGAPRTLEAWQACLCRAIGPVSDCRCGGGEGSRVGAGVCSHMAVANTIAIASWPFPRGRGWGRGVGLTNVNMCCVGVGCGLGAHWQGRRA